MAPEVPFLTALVAGGCAGTTVDVTLFPLDTIKTRLQSPQGFRAAGGFNGIFRGVSAAAAGSAPGAALFFSTYEFMKPRIHRTFFGAADPETSHLSHMLSAACGETTACLVRVPTEITKQRMQVGMHNSIASTVGAILKVDGPLGLFRGYFTTVGREIPFSFIQFPLWELGKKKVRERQNGRCEPWQGALCGAFSGGFSASITTPLDVAKTRIMLGADADGVPYRGTINTIQRVYAEGGLSRCFSGVAPRTFWITIGGFVFFGIYETVLLRSRFARSDEKPNWRETSVSEFFGQDELSGSLNLLDTRI